VAPFFMEWYFASSQPLELPEEANIVLRIETKIVHLIFDLGDTFYTHTECETGINLRVDAEIAQEVGVYHTTTEDLDPARVLAQTAAGTTTHGTGDIHFGTWFSEREVGRAETHLGIGAEHFCNEIIERLLEIGERYIFIYVQSFELMKEAVCPSRDSFVAIHTAGTDDTNRKRSGLEDASLN